MTESSLIVKLRFLAPLLASGAVLSGCLGNSGDSVPPPTDVRSVVGDGIAGITWTPLSGDIYLAFASTNPALSTANWTDTSIAGFAILNAGNDTVPPALICNAPNGEAFYFTVNAHTGTAPSGPGSATVQSTGRSAGGPTTWSAGTPVGANINAVGYAVLTTCLPTSKPTGIYVAVGPAGAIFTSSDSRTWLSRTPLGYTTDLYAATAGTGSINNPTTPNLQFVAVGAGGTVITSADGVTWTLRVPFNGSAPTLRAVSLAGSSFVAVGDRGRVQTSPDGVNWTVQNSATTSDLHGIECVSATCLAVGDGGTIAVSFDTGLSWSLDIVGNGVSALRTISYGNFDNNETGSGVIGINGDVRINTWVVGGDNGTAFQSTAVAPGLTSGNWTAAPIPGAANVLAIRYTTQFVAVDSSGNAFASQTGAPGSWSFAVATGITDPVAMTRNGSNVSTASGFAVLGSSGDNASSF